VEVRERGLSRRAGRRALKSSARAEFSKKTLVLSTCNCSEVYACRRNPHECARDFSTFLSEFHSVAADILGVSLYHHYDQEAVRHLFRVAGGGGPRSMLLGEARYWDRWGKHMFRARARRDRALAESPLPGCPGSRKRVRTETELGTRPMSVASAGVKLAERILWKTKRAKALVLGRHDQRASGLSAPGIVGSRSSSDEPLRDRATSWPSSSARKGRRLGEWDAALQSRMCGSSVSADEPVLRRDIVERAMAARGKSRVVPDGPGVPRNIDPSVGSSTTFTFTHR